MDTELRGTQPFGQVYDVQKLKLPRIVSCVNGASLIHYSLGRQTCPSVVRQYYHCSFSEQYGEFNYSSRYCCTQYPHNGNGSQYHNRSSFSFRDGKLSCQPVIPHKVYVRMEITPKFIQHVGQDLEAARHRLFAFITTTQLSIYISMFWDPLTHVVDELAQVD
jgi:hypothetical protein